MDQSLKCYFLIHKITIKEKKNTLFLILGKKIMFLNKMQSLGYIKFNTAIVSKSDTHIWIKTHNINEENMYKVKQRLISLTCKELLIQ